MASVEILGVRKISVRKNEKKKIRNYFCLKFLTGTGEFVIPGGQGV